MMAAVNRCLAVLLLLLIGLLLLLSLSGRTTPCAHRAAWRRLVVYEISGYSVDMIRSDGPSTSCAALRGATFLTGTGARTGNGFCSLATFVAFFFMGGLAGACTGVVLTTAGARGVPAGGAFVRVQTT